MSNHYIEYADKMQKALYMLSHKQLCMISSIKANENSHHNGGNDILRLYAKNKQKNLMKPNILIH